MKFENLISGLTLKFSGTDSNAYIFIDDVDEDSVSIIEIKIFERKQEFILEIESVKKKIWNNRDMIYKRFEEGDFKQKMIEAMFNNS